MFANNFLKKYVKNNIDIDGYIYENTVTNFTTPYGQIPDDKNNRLVMSVEGQEIGHMYSTLQANITEFKRLTSPFTRDQVQAMVLLHQANLVLDTTYFQDSLLSTLQYYSVRSSEADYLFMSSLNSEQNIPLDSFSLVHVIVLLRDIDGGLYEAKLRLLLSSTYINQEDETGIIGMNILFENSNYDHEDDTHKDQSLIVTDREFLKK